MLSWLDYHHGIKPLVELSRTHMKRVEDALKLLMGE